MTAERTGRRCIRSSAERAEPSRSRAAASTNPAVPAEWSHAALCPATGLADQDDLNGPGAEALRLEGNLGKTAALAIANSAQ